MALGQQTHRYGALMYDLTCDYKRFKGIHILIMMGSIHVHFVFCIQSKELYNRITDEIMIRFHHVGPISNL